MADQPTTKKVVRVKKPWPEDRPRPEPAARSLGNRGRSTGTAVKVKSGKKPPGVKASSLYAQRELVIATLIQERSIARAARRLGIHRTTIQGWMQTEEFATEYRKAREQVLELSIATVGGYVEEAVQTLGRNLSCGRPDSEIRAAAVILQWAGKFMPEQFRNTAGAKLAEATQNPASAAGATVIVVDGSEEDYISGLRGAVET